MDLIVDSREPTELYNFLKRKYKDINITREQLGWGDYVTNYVICERKSVSDLYSSLIDGRYIGQLNKMSTDQNKLFVLLITGNVTNYCKQMRYKKIKCSEDMLYGAIAMAAYRYDFNIIWTPTDRDGLKVLVPYMRKIDENQYLVPTKAFNDVLISRLFKIPRNTVHNLFAEYKTIKKLCDATEPELLEFEGIGKVSAKRIYNLLNEDINEHL